MLEYKKKSMVFDVCNVAASLGIFSGLSFGLNIPIIISGLASVGVYMGSSLLFSPDRRLVLLGIKDHNKQKEYFELLDFGYEKVEELSQVKNKIKNIQVQNQVSMIVNKINTILKYLEKHPNQIGLNKKFFTYYLESILKIVNQYYEISNQNVDSNEIKEVVTKAENALPVINKSLDEQFAKILQNDALDLDTEVDLLNTSFNMKDF